MLSFTNPAVPQPEDFDTVNNIFPGMHFYQFYKQMDDYLRVLIPFFHAGLRKGESGLWLASERMGLYDIESAVRSAIPNLDDYFTSGQFQIRSAETWYCEDGVFDEEKTFVHARQYLAEMQKAGFMQSRIAGDAGAVSHDQWPKAVEYEKKISSLIKSAPIIALCAYPILQCTLTDTKAVLEEHDSVLVGRL
ncbi:MAG: MEDS domain-containing protein [Candidatus Omnitrophica bacterium]|nr:MEDS domain-containing protein [Candidatus Omnitrophota bacterium]